MDSEWADSCPAHVDSSGTVNACVDRAGVLADGSVIKLQKYNLSNIFTVIILSQSEINLHKSVNIPFGVFS